jgi:hypothetical protein
MIRFTCWALLASGLAPAMWAEERPPAGPVGAATSAVTEAKAPGSDLREVLASTTSERNHLREDVGRLRDQQWLLIGYAAVMSIVAGWLARSWLMRGPVAPREEEADTDVFAKADEPQTARTTTTRRNATITIRNAGTQRVEVTEQVQTRRMFAKTDSDQPGR